MKKDQVNRRQLNSQSAKAKKQAVFFGNAIETPSMIRCILRQVAYLFHPMPAPRAGVEVRHHAEGPTRDCLDARSHAIASHELWRGTVCVQEEIGLRQEFAFDAIGG